MGRAITKKRVEKVGEYDQFSLERIIAVQEKQIIGQAQTIQDLRTQLAKAREAHRASLVALLTMDYIDRDTGEVFNLIKIENGTENTTSL